MTRGSSASSSSARVSCICVLLYEERLYDLLSPGAGAPLQHCEQDADALSCKEAPVKSTEDVSMAVTAAGINGKLLCTEQGLDQRRAHLLVRLLLRSSSRARPPRLDVLLAQGAPRVSLCKCFV
jgi:hypothetical protein